MNNRLRLFLMVFLSVFFIAGCQTSPTASAKRTSVDSFEALAKSCLAQGGTYIKQGRLQNYRCIQQFSDAGKSCSDSVECQGSCTSSDITIEAGTSNITGTCAANSSRFGCRQIIQDGVAKGVLCVD